MRLASFLAAAVITLSQCCSLLAGDVSLPPGRDFAPEAVEAGRQLFTMNFARPDQFPRDIKVGDGGNGVGPVFNDTSCVGCHNQGGAGGGGDLESNVVMLGIVTRPKGPASIPAALTSARTLHPDFSENSALKVLHRFAIGHPEDVAAYDAWRDGILKTMGADYSTIPSVRPLRRKIGAATMELAQRNTTALWGAGLIDQFRRGGGDVIRQRVAEEQAERHPWITGRIPKTPSGKEGWFGWRGQIASLDEFTLSACSIELGLNVPGFTEDKIPIATSQPVARITGRAKSPLDLTKENAFALTSFVNSLPRPEVETGSSELQSQIAAGQRAFDRINCTSCHVPDMGWVRGVYSDMLLHDMGYETSDAQTATPARQLRPISSGYYDVVLVVEESKTNPEQEWKTPPLWGVADSAPYYHDGRAATLKEAIQIHAGEAERSAAAFRQLDQSDQDALLAFLNSLKAPSVARAKASP